MQEIYTLIFSAILAIFIVSYEKKFARKKTQKDKQLFDQLISIKGMTKTTDGHSDYQMTRNGYPISISLGSRSNFFSNNRIVVHIDFLMDCPFHKFDKNIDIYREKHSQFNWCGNMITTTFEFSHLETNHSTLISNKTDSMIKILESEKLPTITRQRGYQLGYDYETWIHQN